ncbi:FAD-dependent oxidoreductase [Streptosporangium sp. NPDC050855]|uniref:FAD-dependent oxidoreductase n=1 Tax=Streptosporangium sp. NPDC050855 TaxID=3366194 RepID=UPI0037AA2768
MAADGDGAVVRRDVVIVGGGPAGLTAAARLAASGLTVTILDEQPELGGQYYRRPAPEVARVWGDHRPEGGRLIGRVRAAGVECRTGHLVWGVADDGSTLLASDAAGRAVRLRGRYVILATGAYERVFPFPGWRLPGVTTPGFAQHLAADHTSVGDRVVLAGSGPFLLPVACSLLALGVTVAGIAEVGTPYRPGPRASGALLHPARLRELAGYAARLARARVPLWQRTVVLRADGRERVSSVTLASAATPGRPIRTVEVDALCVGYGFRPQTDLARMLGCATGTDAVTGEVSPLTGPAGRSSRDEVYVVGEAAGVGGVHAAVARGMAAAHDILAREHGALAREHGTPAREHGALAREQGDTRGRDDAGDRDGPRAPALGKGRGPVPASEIRRWTRARRRAEHFAALTGSIYPGPALLLDTLAASVPDETPVCRCEAITAGEIRETAAARAGGDLNATKAWTRAGMGPCQGRECGFAVSALVRAARPGETADQPVEAFPSRTPVRPVPVATLLEIAESRADGTTT